MPRKEELTAHAKKTAENPIAKFSLWFEEAKKLGLKDPNAMALATATKAGEPSVRIVLLKAFDERGFVFFTNKTSRKGSELMENPVASLCLYWEGLDKQIRMEGRIEETSAEESDRYHSSRHPISQIGAWASLQSQPLETYQTLMDRVDMYRTQHGEGSVPRPPHWGGFRLVPESIEFWHAGNHRLHRREIYLRSGGNWLHTMLHP